MSGKARETVMAALGLVAPALVVLFPWAASPAVIMQALEEHDRRLAGEQDAARLKPERGLRIRETADRCSCSTRTVWRLIREKQLITLKIGARSTGVRESDVEKLLNSGAAVER